MSQKNWEVELYEKPNGKCPTEEFLASLSDGEHARMDRQIGRLEAWGPDLRRPDAAHLRDKIHELRAVWQGVRLRILYFRDGNKFILCLGWRNKTGPVPDPLIDTAVEYRENYFVRKREEAG